MDWGITRQQSPFQSGLAEIKVSTFIQVYYVVYPNQIEVANHTIWGDNCHQYHHGYWIDYPILGELFGLG